LRGEALAKNTIRSVDILQTRCQVQHYHCDYQAQVVLPKLHTIAPQYFDVKYRYLLVAWFVEHKI